MVESWLAAQSPRRASSTSTLAASKLYKQEPTPLIRQLPATTRQYLSGEQCGGWVFSSPNIDKSYWGLLEAQYYSQQYFSYVMSFLRTWPVWNAFAFSTYGQP